METADASHSPEAASASLLSLRGESRQVVVGEAFQSLLVGATRTPTTVETTMFIKKLAEKLLGGGLGGGVSRASHLLSLPLKPLPIG